MGAPIELICCPTNRGVTAHWLVFDPAQIYTVRYGDPTAARLRAAQAADMVDRPWMRNATPQGNLTTQVSPFIYHRTEPTHDPISAISEWLLQNGAHPGEHFSLEGGYSVVKVFSLKNTPEYSRQLIGAENGQAA